MTWLDKVVTGKIRKPRRILCYGTKGIGKSTFAANAPDPIFIPTEEGANDLAVAKFPVATEYGQVIEYINDLYKGDHGFKTAVIDTADWLERLLWSRMCVDCRVQHIEQVDGGYGKGYTRALLYWRDILSGLDALRDHRGMTIILLAHSKIEKFDGPNNDAYDRYAPRIDKRASDLLQEWCDEILFATYEVFTKQSGLKGSKGIGTGARYLCTTERPSHIAKNRLGLPDQMSFEWKAYEAYAQAA
jgi:GTPase SAR1 family protein